MPETNPVDVARSAYEAWNAHDVEQILSLNTPDSLLESDTNPGPVRGPDELRRFAQAYLAAFPDLRFDVEETFASGDRVASRWTATGTHRGEFRGLPATGRAVTVHGCTVNEVRGGKIARAWVYWDSATLMRQLGLLGGREAEAGRR
jgi:steroid delta-isomerase-like uncharacterized protein